MRKYFFLFVLVACIHQCFGQDGELDSLITLLSKIENHDSTYVKALNEIAFQLSMTDQQQSIYYINQAISIAKEIGYEQGLIRATTIKGSSFLVVGLPDQALSYYLEALSYNVSKYPIDHVRLNNNIGEVYRRKGVFDSSLSYFNRALAIALEKLPQNKPVIIYSNLGEVSLMQGQVDTAEEYFGNCLINALSSNHLRGIGYGYYGLAECSFLKGSTSEAIELMKNSIAYRRKADHKRGLIQSYLKIGDYFDYGTKNSDSALFYWQKGELLAKSFKANDLLNEAYDKLYTFHLSRNEINDAAFYLEKHKQLGDSIRNAEFISNVAKMKSALQSELVLAENRLLKQEQQQRQAEEEARLIVLVLTVLIAGGLGLSTYQYRVRQKKINETKKENLFTNTLLTLSKELNNTNFNLDSFIQELLDLSRQAIECDRATYWVYNKENNSVCFKALSSIKEASNLPSTEILLSQFPDFFNDFVNNRTLSIQQISKDERLKNIYKQYFKVAGIESLLNAPIHLDGEFAGMISFTMLRGKTRAWTVNEERYVGSLVDIIIAAIANERSNILEQEKEGLIQKLKSRNKSLLEFNSVISHNLREPLTQIIGFSDLLKSENEVPLTKDIVDKIGHASNRIDKVIKELSTVLNVKDPTPADYRELSIEKIIKEALDLLKSELDDQNITIEQNLAFKKIKTYRPFLVDSFYHILSNCIKFSDPSKRLHIHIKSYEDELNRLIVISDNGRGMNLNKVGDKLFKMYQRFHLDVDGRGMGLFIVKSRINALNGWVKIESEEGIGTAVIIELPKEISVKIS